MKNKETGKVNASLVISMIALFAAISGVATAGKNNGHVKLPPNSVGSAQLKPGAVKATDIGKKAVVSSKVAPNAVTTRALAPDAVTADILAPASVTSQALGRASVLASALAPNSVTTTALAPEAVNGDAIRPGAVTTQSLAKQSVGKEKMKDDAVGTEQLEEDAVTENKIGPRAVTAIKIDATPGAQVTSAGTAMNDSFLTCYMRSDVPFNGVERNVGGVYDVSNPERLTAPMSGIYRVSAGVSWPNSGGNGRLLSVSRTIGPATGYNEGEHYTVQSVTTAPLTGSSTDQALSFDVALDQGDYLTLHLATCGENVTAGKSNLGMVWTGPAS